MGFFFEQVATTEAQSSSLKILHTLECKVCPLDRVTLGSPKMHPSGTTTPVVYALGEAPGETEDRVGEPFVGKAGALLRECIPRDWLPRMRLANVIRCRPTEGTANRTPAFAEIEACRPYSIRDIERTHPYAIFGFGATPLQWVLGVSGISEWRGRRVPVQIGKHSCWFYPMFHPSYILRSEFRQPELRHTFARDIATALEEIERLRPPVLFSPQEVRAKIDILPSCTAADVRVIRRFLRSLQEDTQVVGVDFETNGLRPYRTNAKILSLAVSSPSRTLAFPLQHREATWSAAHLAEVQAEVQRFFLESRCQKVAHNMAFELEWSFLFYGVPKLGAQRWHDTEAAGYCLDERRGMLGLDAMIHALFGFSLKNLSSVDVKRLDEEPLAAVLWYNGMDARWCRALLLPLLKQLEERGLMGIYQEQLRRIPTMVLTQIRGLGVNQTALRRFKEEQEVKIQELERQMQRDPAATAFRKLLGRPFNPSSSPDVVILCRDVLKRSEGYKKTGAYSTDEAVLASIDHPLLNVIRQYRTTTKLYALYFEGLSPGGKSLQDDGRIHTSLNTFFTETGRLSSDSPNIQNFPKRKDAWVRAIIVPPKRHLFLSCDYGQIEGRVIAMASQDRTLRRMLVDRYDVHQDWAERFVRRFPALLKRHGDMQAMRQVAKNQVVFPAFYGSISASIARNLGVDEYPCAELMEEFWDIFQGVKAWQGRLYQFYEEHGYVECLTGRRRHHPLSANKIINSPIQGTASDIVVDAMTRLSEYGRSVGESQFQVCMNVHDDLMFSLPTRTCDQDMEIIVKSMLLCPYDFVNVPLSVEISIGKNWYEMEKIDTCYSDEWE